MKTIIVLFALVALYAVGCACFRRINAVRAVIAPQIGTNTKWPSLLWQAAQMVFTWQD